MEQRGNNGSYVGQRLWRNNKRRTTSRRFWASASLYQWTNLRHYCSRSRLSESSRQCGQCNNVRFPVLYEMVSFEIEQLFAGDPAIKQQVIEAAKKLEAEGVRAVIGACGYFAHFQKDVAAAVGVPVFMSSLCQLATIKTWLPCDRKIAVFAADGASIDDEFLSNVNTTTDQIVVVNVGDMESFAPIRWGKGPLNNGKLEDDLCALAKSVCESDPKIDAILLECSDLPPYAAAIQRATGLPVFDFITLAKWVESAVMQRPYYGAF